ncbi:helix-turn-helix domain-containing protein [Bacillus paralicheniformis]|uniref:helix-turn-helix domain-containing protein n=1 Tax=Bacillus paralicheniformis TaxID=1648923 RepID=UPI002DB99AC1|nr:helix-turn-helix transcriptional regulator [Bacillus paralicheniformis]MEC1024399.1 helix-turn-helix transcriptional regulator [Bacillus paralicheniformis]MEC1027385.1 helix-turn-helix transcriptional regulator [Bacillus paralicheniformis]MEC1034480.1 helix-turn-helix transcriptional regulator [Bacillus paralicheniformis]MEC1053006.1 helix-turn-helix transcriptional regulator [Bacillus paralicheniformis]MEC1059925.1 helix-turn-helix transcriptional regulator [Bacillus paralicheniformis]
MVNVNKLRGKIVENGMSIGELAKKIGIDRSTFYRKLNSNGETFSIKEANLICDVLGLTSEEATVIFFNHSVA